MLFVYFSFVREKLNFSIYVFYKIFNLTGILELISILISPVPLENLGKKQN